jgi:outer membrane protein OmpA-like peptidoglycan-associated protein
LSRSLVSALAVVAVAAIAGSAAWLTYSPLGDTIGLWPRGAKHAAGSGTAAVAPALPINQSALTEVNGAPKTRGSSAMPKADDASVTGAPSAAAKPWRGDSVSRIHFALGSSVINDASRPTLDTIVAAMKTTSDVRVSIEGHTDARGTADYNQTLSERRAEAVRAYLEAAGIAPGRLRPVGFGASRPLVPNDGTGDDLNRRVELRLR